MKVGVLAVLVLASTALAGCNAGTANPHLLAPKLVVQPQEDGNVTLYVHSAFGEQLYDRMALSIENVTVATRSNAFSLETKVAAAGFYVEVTTEVDDERYVLRARLDVDPVAARVRIVPVLPTGAWGTADTFGLPYERIIERSTP